MKPRGLLETTIAMCLMNIAGFIFIDPKIGFIGAQYAFVAIVVSITFVVLWHYWNGRNWARILVLLTGVLALFNLVALQSVSRLSGSLIVIESLFGAFMLWWLNTTSVKRYFKKSQTEILSDS